MMVRIELKVYDNREIAIIGPFTLVAPWSLVP
jgi:hypothetical protein